MLRSLFVWILGLVMIAPALATPIESSEPIFKRSDRMALENIHQRFPDMATLPLKEEQILVSIRAGSTYWDARLLASSSAQVRKAIQAIEKIAPEAQTTSYQETGLVHFSQAHLGQSEASQNVPAGPVVTVLRQAGFTPSVVLIVGNYVQTQLPTPAPPYFSGKNSSYYDVRKVSEDQTITVHAIMPTGLRILSIGLPVIGIIVAFFGCLFGGRLPRAQARLVLSVLSAGAFLTMGLGTWLMMSGTIQPLCDLWMGEWITGPKTSWIMTAPLVFFLLPMLVIGPKIRQSHAATSATAPGMAIGIGMVLLVDLGLMVVVMQKLMSPVAALPLLFASMLPLLIIRRRR
ncbi:MAG: hypothetical protein QM758_19130 [Armatimonas sp.]